MPSFARIFAMILLSSSALHAEIMKPSEDSSSSLLQLNWMDKSISPDRDFYSYANGIWKTQNPIPPEYAT